MPNPDFTSQEHSTICLFFGKTPSDDVFELSEVFFLESGSVEHPAGDKLEVVTNGYIVTFPDEGLEPFYFQRDFAGLVAALERFTQQFS